MLLSFAVVVGEDANNGMDCCCWRGRQQRHGLLIFVQKHMIINALT